MGKLGVIIFIVVILTVGFIGYLILLYLNKKQATKKDSKKTESVFAQDLELIQRVNKRQEEKASTNIASSSQKVEDFEQAYNRYNKKHSFFDTDTEQTLEQETQVEAATVKATIKTTEVIEKGNNKTTIEVTETINQKVKRYQNSIMETISFIQEQRDK